MQCGTLLCPKNVNVKTDIFFATDPLKCSEIRPVCVLNWPPTCQLLISASEFRKLIVWSQVFLVTFPEYFLSYFLNISCHNLQSVVWSQVFLVIFPKYFCRSSRVLSDPKYILPYFLSISCHISRVMLFDPRYFLSCFLSISCLIPSVSRHIFRDSSHPTTVSMPARA